MTNRTKNNNVGIFIPSNSLFKTFYIDVIIEDKEKISRILNIESKAKNERNIYDIGILFMYEEDFYLKD